MPVVRNGDRDGIHVRLLQNLAKVLVVGGSISQQLRRGARELCQSSAVYIANMRQAGRIFVSFKSCEMSIAALAQAYDCKVDTLVGTDDLTVALCRRPDGQTCRAYRYR